MEVEWYGQSAFRLGAGDATVFVDPFGDMSGLAARGVEFGYPPIRGVDADLLLVTHEHPDHNGVEAVGGSPAVLRSTAGRLESPVGEVLAVASERVNFLEPADDFLGRMGEVRRLETPRFETTELADGPLAVVLAAP